MSCKIRPWAELIPDALGIIFCKLELKEIIKVVPLVCKPWGLVVNGSYCWKDIDITAWTDVYKNKYKIDRMIRMLAIRSNGTMHRFAASHVTDSAFSFIANNAQSLEVLQIPRSTIKDSTVVKHAGKLINLTFLDVSECSMIGPPALEAIGNHCRFLVKLMRRMGALYGDYTLVGKAEAYAIASTMPNLRYLDMSGVEITTPYLDKILSQWKQMKYPYVDGSSLFVFSNSLGTMPDGCEFVPGIMSKVLHHLRSTLD